MVWFVISVCCSLALTSLFFREGWFLYTIIGGSGKISFNVWLFLIDFQCFFIICLSLCKSSQKFVIKTSFVFFFVQVFV